MGACAGFLAGAAVLASTSAWAAGNEFTYQGKLQLAGQPVNDTCDFRFRLYDAAGGGVQIGAQLTAANVTVVDGIMTVDLDFGPGIFTGGNRFLEIDVRCPAGAGAYTTLSPRQPITAAPYALKSLGNTMSWVDYSGEVRTADNVGIGVGNEASQAKFHIKSSDANIPNSFLWNDDMIIEEKNNDAVLGLYAEVGKKSAITFGDTFASSAGVKWSMYRSSNTLNFEWAGSGLGQGTRLVTMNGSTVDPAFGIMTPTSPQSTFQVGTFLHVDLLDPFMGVNRSDPITGSEIFGLSQATSSYAGMYIETTNTSRAGRPFYGYAVNGASEAWTYFDAATSTWRVNASGDRFAISQSTGHVGVGTTAPAERLHVVGGTDTEIASGGYIVTGATNSSNISMDNNEIQARNNGGASILYLNHGGGNVHVGQNSGGTVRLVTPVIQITGGSDFSEMFDVGGDVDVEPGMVVVIDAENPGRLIPSTHSYDCKVAGVVSGAGGVGTGMIMAHDGTIADGEHPVALSGRVYCLVDAANGAIEPGDMLTTSDRPGHAMKATDRDRGNGSIIGKAMTSLEEGEVGLVLVLVNLQ